MSREPMTELQVLVFKARAQTEGSTIRLAEQLRVTRRAIEHWLAGRRIPRPKYVKKLNKIMGK